MRARIALAALLVERRRAPARRAARSRSATRFAVSSSSNSRSFSATAMKPISRPTAGTANWPARSARRRPPGAVERLGARRGRRTRRAPTRPISASTHMSPQDTAPPARRHQRTATPACATTIERDERAHRGGEALVRRELAERGGGDGGPGEEEGTQAAEDEQGAELGLARRRARSPRRRSARRARSGSARRRRRRSARPARRRRTGSGARTA